jgi:hypothetical protein
VDEKEARFDVVLVRRTVDLDPDTWQVFLSQGRLGVDMEKRRPQGGARWSGHVIGATSVEGGPTNLIRG